LLALYSEAELDKRVERTGDLMMTLYTEEQKRESWSQDMSIPKMSMNSIVW